jgi:hypothetical protein
MVAGFEEIVVSDDERCNVGIASLEKVSDGLNTGVDGLTTYLLSNPDPLSTGRAATSGVAKRARAISLVTEVYILKVM